MAGLDKEYTGEAWVAEGARVGYLEQEPQLDAKLSVRENVMQGVAKQKAILDRYNELAVNYSDETADEMTKLQDEIEAQGLWDLDSKVDQAMDALRCPPDDADVTKLTSYQYRIKAANPDWTTSATPGYTAYSNTATATTPDAGPSYKVRFGWPAWGGSIRGVVFPDSPGLLKDLTHDLEMIQGNLSP